MITCWPSLFRPAEGRRVPVRALLERVKTPRTYAAKDDVPRWSWGTYRDNYRSLDAFQTAMGLAFDFDAGASIAQLEEAFGDFCGFAHTTWSNSPALLRWRVGLLLTRAVDREEHDRVWRAGAAIAERAGLDPDYAARDASRAWALPARHDGDHYKYIYKCIELTGALFDVDQALQQFPKPQPLPEPLSGPRDESYEHRLERAAKYLARMPGGIEGSRGSDTTFKAAVAMVRGFHLDPKDALRLLTDIHNPLCQPPWSARELEHKTRQAFRRGRLPVGFIADRPLERRTA